jgi:hypothetical protein
MFKSIFKILVKYTEHFITEEQQLKTFTLATYSVISIFSLRFANWQST